MSYKLCSNYNIIVEGVSLIMIQALSRHVNVTKLNKVSNNYKLSIWFEHITELYKSIYFIIPSHVWKKVNKLAHNLTIEGVEQANCEMTWPRDGMDPSEFKDDNVIIHLRDKSFELGFIYIGAMTPPTCLKESSLHIVMC